MCGIAGWVGEGDGRPREEAEAILSGMTEALRHRGPDDRGLYLDRDVGLGHRRLSIIDIAGGHQPMASEDGSLIVVFNGEIYNFLELRSDLERRGHRFRSRSDTEVLLALYETYGSDMLEHLNGMFAFALWDTRQRRLLAARDRAGKKPFYYLAGENRFLFASELKALLRHPALAPEIDPLGLAQYLAFEYVPAPQSILAGVRKLPAGTALWVAPGAAPRLWRYWSPRYAGRDDVVDEDEACRHLETLLDDAVRLRLISDVPLGVFLSGGIDSSAVVALMSRHVRPEEINTFSIGFREESFDESSHARRLARHFGTSHHEEILDGRGMLEILPEVIAGLDEPFADPSVVPTYLLSRFTRSRVKVALGGDGADELFAGYPTFIAEKLVRRYDRLVPRWMDRLVGAVVDRLPVSHRDMSLDFLLHQFLRGTSREPAGRHMAWLGSFSDDMRDALLKSGAGAGLETDEVYRTARAALAEAGSDDPMQEVLNLYFRLYLQDDILFKVDRASMLNSLEVRCPFLDYRVVEAAQKLPARYKIRGRRLKYILKRMLAGRLPQPILDRPKKGFGIPVGQWIRAELREEIADVLSPRRIEQGGLFSAPYVRRLLDEHLAGRRNHRKPIWTLFMFEKWRETWLKPGGAG